MKLGILISQTEPETVFNALRLANCSLQQGDTVKIFLVGKGVELDQINDRKSMSSNRRKSCSRRAGNSSLAARA